MIFSTGFAAVGVPAGDAPVVELIMDDVAKTLPVMGWAYRTSVDLEQAQAVPMVYDHSQGKLVTPGQVAGCTRWHIFANADDLADGGSGEMLV